MRQRTWLDASGRIPRGPAPVSSGLWQTFRTMSMGILQPRINTRLRQLLTRLTRLGSHVYRKYSAKLLWQVTEMMTGQFVQSRLVRCGSSLFRGVSEGDPGRAGIVAAQFLAENPLLSLRMGDGVQVPGGGMMEADRHGGVGVPDRADESPAHLWTCSHLVSSRAPCPVVGL